MFLNAELTSEPPVVFLKNKDYLLPFSLNVASYLQEKTKEPLFVVHFSRKFEIAMQSCSEFVPLCFSYIFKRISLITNGK